MCGGEYKQFETPRQLSVVCGEELVARTIRLLKENGINDIAISSNNPIFEKFGVPILKHDNNYVISEENKVISGQWFNAFYPTDDPVCYIFGDVYFSEKAIKTIVETETDDIELFGSKKPFTNNYIKEHEEPFALKVMKPKHLQEAIKKARKLDEEHKFWRKPLVWELFTVIKNAPLQTKKDEYTTDYTGISDYTVDIDRPDDVKKLNKMLGGIEMIKCEVIKEFTLEKYDELKNIKRKSIEVKGKLLIGDTFECEKEMADYLMGGNSKNETVVKIIEIIPPIRKNDVENIILLNKKQVEKLSKEILEKVEVKKAKKKTSKK
jgi:hypothetical protein